MVIEEVPIPQIGAGGVLVRVAACGICRTDLEYLQEIRTPKEPPIVLGHEPSGTIEEVGDGVESLHRGDRVIISCIFPCGRCPACRSGHPNLCASAELIGASRDGAYAEFIAAPQEGVYPLPEELPLEESAILSDALATPYHALVCVAQVKQGDTVAIFGASGGLGLAAVEIASSLGATVIGVGRQAWKLEKAKEFGASYVISTLEVSRVDREINRITLGGADISLDASGIPSLIEAAGRSTRPGGRVVVMGFSLGKIEIPINRLVWLEHSIHGSKNYHLDDLKMVIQMAQRGMVHSERLVSHRFALEDINEAFRALDRGEMLRGIVVP
jgi:D-arabinose 1-dehydrogenase-like Zn-dependent alcohol dehydrogenase